MGILSGRLVPIISSLRGTAKIIGVFTGLIFGQRVDAEER